MREKEPLIYLLSGGRSAWSRTARADASLLGEFTAPA